MTIRIIDLFGGVGGFRLGLERAGDVECVGYYEIDKYAVQTYNTNIKERHEPGDIREVDAGGIPDHDLLCAGFPCQSFSIAGRREGFDDTRGTLFFEIARVLEEKRPEVCLLENVLGLLSHDEGRTFGKILDTLQSLGYRLEWQVLNSKDWGVPQNRERVFIVGWKGDREQTIFPIFPKESGTRVTLADVLEDEVPEKYYLSERMVKHLQEHLERHKALGHGFGMRVLDKDTITAPACEEGYGTRSSAGYVANTISQRYHKDGSENLIRIKELDNKFRFHKDDYRKSGMQGKDVMKTEAICDIVDNHPKLIQVRSGRLNDIREYKGESPTLTENLGTGGGNVPMVYNLQPEPKISKDDGNSYGLDTKGCRQAVEVKNGKEVASVLRHGRGWETKDDGTSHSLKGARGGHSKVHVMEVANAVDCDENGRAVLTPMANRRLRRLTPLECFRLQGFPDSWIEVPAIGNDAGYKLETMDGGGTRKVRIRGKKMSDTQLYRQAGNAVTVNVIEAIGRRLLPKIEGLKGMA